MTQATGPAPALLTVQGLTVRFGQLLAVDDVHLSVEAGQLLGLIGPNGAGKTTLLRAIATLQPALRGRMLLGGEPLTRRSGHLLRYLGFTPDTPPVYEDMTVRQFLCFAGMGYELTPAEIQDRIGFWLERVCSPKRPTRRSSRSRAACASASASPGPCCPIPPWSCSMSRPPGSTRPGGSSFASS